MKKLTVYYLFTAFLFLASFASAQELPEAFVGPGGCTSKEECREYCGEDNHKEECLTFAVENGLMTQEEADKALKFLKQTGPGGCRGEACKEYCEDSTHVEECISFAEEHGFIEKGEGERFRKFREIAEKGGPGGCKGEECREYCEDESRHDECFAFARENGLLEEEDLKHYETALKVREKIKETGGPGGCENERKCREYCSDVSHIEECVEFGARLSGQSQDEVRRMLEEFKKHRQEMREGRRFRQLDGGRPEGFEGASRSRFQGPGGCDSEESCRQYCMANPESCGFMRRSDESMMRRPPESMMMPPEGYRSLEGYPAPGSYPRPEDYQQYQQNYEQTPSYQLSPPPSEPSPTSYDRSRSFLSNMASAFLAPFRK